MDANKLSTPKSIVLYVPGYFHGFREIVEQQLEQVGFTVYSIKDGSSRFKLQGTIKPLIRLFRRLFLGDKNYKAFLNEQRIEKLIAQQLTLVKDADFALIFRPDELSIKSLDEIKRKTKAMYAYQWDGFSRFPRIYERLIFFKKIYSVDANDIKSGENVYAGTNFYFDSKPPVNLNARGPKDSIAYYIGAYNKQRIKSLRQIRNQLVQLKIKTEIYILHGPIIMPSWIIRLKKAKMYRDVLKDVELSDVVIDIDLRGTHDALTLRIFEAIGYQKKLITTNELVKNQDFYNPSNIFIFNGSLDELQSFLNKPMVPLDPEILRKYSFSEWVKRVLEIS